MTRVLSTSCGLKRPVQARRVRQDVSCGPRANIWMGPTKYTSAEERKHCETPPRAGAWRALRPGRMLGEPIPAPAPFLPSIFSDGAASRMDGNLDPCQTWRGASWSLPRGADVQPESSPARAVLLSPRYTMGKGR